jgi:hypothetical protein
VNYFHNARVMCEQLSLRGCKRIGFVGSDTFCVRTNEAFSAAAAWQNLRSGGAPVKPLVFKTHAEMTAGFDTWLKGERPDAIIAHAENILSHMRERLPFYSGGRVLLTCTSINSPKSICPGIDERHELIGHKAVDILTGLLNRNEKNLRTTHAGTLVDGQWIEPGASAEERPRRR